MEERKRCVEVTDGIIYGPLYLYALKHLRVSLNLVYEPVDITRSAFMCAVLLGREA